MSHALSSLLRQTSLQYLPHTSFSPSPPTLSRSTSAPSLLPDSGENVAQLRVAQSKRKAHTTSKAAKPWTTGPPPPHTSRTGKARKKGKKVRACTWGQNPLFTQLLWTGLEKKTLYIPAHCTSAVACMRSLCPSRPTPWALTAACASLGGKSARAADAHKLSCTHT